MVVLVEILETEKAVVTLEMTAGLVVVVASVSLE